MATNTTPIFVGTVVSTGARITSSIQTIRDNTSGSLTPIFIAGANGSRVDFITFTNSGTGSMSSMVWRVFLSDTTGSNFRLLKETAITGISTTVTTIGATATMDFTPYGLNIAANVTMSAGQSVYAGFPDQTDVIVRGGHY